MVSSRSSYYLFLRRPLLLIPTCLFVIPFFTSRSSGILSLPTCAYHHVLLLLIHSPTFCIPHFSLISSLFILSSLVTFIILRIVFISVVSNNWEVFAVSGLVSAAYVNILDVLRFIINNLLRLCLQLDVNKYGWGTTMPPNTFEYSGWPNYYTRLKNYIFHTFLRV